MIYLQCINRSEGNYFDDDTMIYSEGYGYDELLHILQSDTANIGQWFKQNRLTVNVEKKRVNDQWNVSKARMCTRYLYIIIYDSI